ncbi:hypothetical protein HHI36_020092 [Cryptolaemus montrouzieri]|uniref:G-protein coupled receptors family 1 profile domain-containing protein n=1 Tax=Cryptolaemus montrouzieri TaxID=559131 RepID=A0ABD2N969_9CUCU
MEKNITYCDLQHIKAGYQEIHGYLSLIVCFFGSLTNILNIFVLKTKHLRSPTNFILIGLAFADLLVMLEYVPFVIHRNLASRRTYASHFTYNWARFYMFHAYFGQVAHFTSCCLTIILAVWRYVYISMPQGNTVCANSKRTVIVILITYLLCPILCLPVLVTLEVRKYPQPCNESGVMISKKDRNGVVLNNLHNETIWVIRPNDPYGIALWIYSVLLKLAPCVLLTFLFYKIISALMETRRRRGKLMNKSMAKKLNEGFKSNDIHIYKETQADRTTRMLLAVLLLFLLTEFPQALLGSISAVYGEVFLEECYSPLGNSIKFSCFP